MKLIHTGTREALDANIDRVSEPEVADIVKSRRFIFDWRLELQKEIYKVYLKKDDEVVGLISLIDVPEELRVHIDLIEAAIEHTGREKKISRIPGCLIAFACELSFKRGYQGFVSLVPKTRLIGHYVRTYGFRQHGRMLALEGERSRFLIMEYLEDEL